MRRGKSGLQAASIEASVREPARGPWTRSRLPIRQHAGPVGLLLHVADVSDQIYGHLAGIVPREIITTRAIIA